MKNTSTIRFGIAACIAAAAGLPTSVLAQPLTTTWTYQGKLLSAGNPATSPVDIRFRLFDSAALLTGQVGVDLFALNTTPTDGTFATQLNFGPTAFNGNRRWVEIAVRPAGGGAYTTLSPRQEVTAAPYSLYALNVSPSATPWIFSGANATYTGTGNVGAGTASPTAKLHILGTDSGTGQALNANNKLYVTNSFVGVNRTSAVSGAEAFGVQALITGNNYGGMYIRTDSATGKPFYGYANTGGASMWTYMDGADNSWRVNMGSADRLTISSAGNVGIGTSAPLSPLDIAVADKRLQFRLDGGLVPGINLAGTGGNLGILRLRNGLEIWPNDAATSPGFMTIRNAAAATTLSFDGGTGNSWMNGTLGVGTTTPEGTIHAFKGSAGAATADGNSALVLENSSRGYLSILTPDAEERGILFGDPLNNSDGGVMYNNVNTPNGLQFRTSGNTSRMAITSAGNVGIGTTSPAQRFDVRGGVSNTDFTINPGSLFGVANATAVTLDTSGTGTIGVWDNFRVNNGLTVDGATTLAGAMSISGAASFFNQASFNNGGAPFTVASTTKVTNLNADLLDGLDSSQFLVGIPNPLAVSGLNGATGTITGTNSSSTANSAGVRGISTAATGGVWGVWGTAQAVAGAGVFGINSTAGGTGVRGLNNAGTGGGVGVFGQVNSTSDGSYGVYGSAINGGRGVVGDSTSSDGVWGVSGSGVGVRGVSDTNAGVAAYTSTGGIALYAERTSNGNKGWLGGAGEGGWAESSTGDGFIAKAFAANKSGIYCENTNTAGNAIYANGKGYFVGEISVPVITIRGGADVAEPFDVASSPMTATSDATDAAPGMLVVIDAASPGKLMVSSESYDTKVAGIISGANGLAPGLTLRAIDHQHADGDHAVAMTGRVWCYVDASYGAVTPGDRLTTSPTPGHAMKVSDDTRAPGSVVGKAMTPLANGEKGLVLVLVNLQ